MSFPALSTDKRNPSIYRRLRIVLYLVVLAGLVLYGRYFYPVISLQLCLEHPQRYYQQIINIGNEAVIEQVKDDGFVIRYLHHLVAVEGNTSNLKVGEYVYLRARFIAPDRLELMTMHIAEGRRMKIMLSIIPAVFIIFWFLRRFRWRFTSFDFVER
ncbi:MAG: hypothetical protein EHM72_20290 [Calditrichaeota bacterium]|nr:MAG: hypothetical protein EHM72_20290 [Calditrichota bacterium]